MKVVFHEDFFQVYTGDPASAPGRLEAVMEVIRGPVDLVTPEPAAWEDIAAVHTRRHMESVERMGLHNIAALAAGGAVWAAEIGLVEPCFALIRPPGHHASADACWGFCYYNNVAVALQAMIGRKRIDTAYVLDIDLHFGDGTENILGGRRDITVHNVSAHDRRAYVEEVAEAMQSCRADLICVSAGFDNHAQDWGGVMDTDDYREIGRLVRDSARARGKGCFAVLEGGYNHQVLGHNVMALIQGMSE